MPTGPEPLFLIIAMWLEPPKALVSQPGYRQVLAEIVISSTVIVSTRSRSSPNGGCGAIRSGRPPAIASSAPRRSGRDPDSIDDRAPGAGWEPSGHCPPGGPDQIFGGPTVIAIALGLAFAVVVISYSNAPIDGGFGRGTEL